MDEPVDIVRAGYDALGSAYLDWSARIVDDPRNELVAAFARRLPDEARVVDLGCGPGLPTTRDLAARFEVVGVDISPVQLELARGNVSRATFIESDLRALRFPARSLDGVVALYSLGHVPREDHPDLLEAIASWLKPGGLLLACLPAGESSSRRGEWLGVSMFFNGLDDARYRELLQGVGFSLIHDEIRTMREPEGDATFLWIMAEKSAHPLTEPGH
jgi:trans-aconitate methyltransferase